MLLAFRTHFHTELSIVYLQLLNYDPAKALPVSSFPLSILPEAYPSINCFQALDYLYANFSGSCKLGADFPQAKQVEHIYYL